MINESELKKQLSKGQFKNLYLVFGEEKMLVKRAVEQIEKKLTGGDINDFNYHVFGDGADISEISVSADIIPFMGGYNIVRINDMDIDKLKSDDYDALMKILKNLPDTTVAIITMPTLDVSSKTAKAQLKKLITFADKNGVCMELVHRSGLALERDLCKWANSGGCSMSELTAHQLIGYVGEDLNLLNTEMKKLTAYANGAEITPEMIDLLVTKSTEASIYDLFGFIVAENTDKTMSAIAALYYDGVNGMTICSVLSNAYLDAYRARVGSQAGKKTAQIAADFSYGRREWVLSKALKQIRSVTTPALRRSLDAILDTQTRLVTEAVDDRTEVEKLVCRLILIAGDRSDE